MLRDDAVHRVACDLELIGAEHDPAGLAIGPRDCRELGSIGGNVVILALLAIKQAEIVGCPVLVDALPVDFPVGQRGRRVGHPRAVQWRSVCIDGLADVAVRPGCSSSRPDCAGTCWSPPRCAIPACWHRRPWHPRPRRRLRHRCRERPLGSPRRRGQCRSRTACRGWP